ncbi:hypothetical protein V5799_007006 [Amblyomma americanum]|uniref:Uncharacterized protein n=1 Tax=Amblyomma americanum TaxID=6943 RepID=A0AAQ4DUS4_AMBAM
MTRKLAQNDRTSSYFVRRPVRPGAVFRLSTLELTVQATGRSKPGLDSTAFGGTRCHCVMDLCATATCAQCAKNCVVLKLTVWHELWRLVWCQEL